MKILVTEGHSFLGWHLRVRLRAVQDQPVEVLDRAALSDPSCLQHALLNADTLVHLAGVTRVKSDSVVEQGNDELGTALHDAVLANGRRNQIVYPNSIQAGNGTPYGIGKQRAGWLLRRAAANTRTTLTDVLLPNLFGEHGRQHYNSFVATFCHELAHWGGPSVEQDRIVPLLHAQRAANALTEAMRHRVTWQEGDYLRIPVDAGGPNYDADFDEGSIEESAVDDYTSDSTDRLGVEDVKRLLLTLPNLLSRPQEDPRV